MVKSHLLWKYNTGEYLENATFYIAGRNGIDTVGTEIESC